MSLDVRNMLMYEGLRKNNIYEYFKGLRKSYSILQKMLEKLLTLREKREGIFVVKISMLTK